MLVATQARKKRNSTKVNLVISLMFHGLILGALLYFAAREGLLGKQIRKIAVEMVKEKPKEVVKPKEPEKPKVDVAKTEAPKAVEAPRAEAPKNLAPPPASTLVAPPAVAPPVAELPAFEFEGGKTVVSSSDPVQLYKGLMESSLRFNWDRPKDVDGHTFVDEVKIAVDKDGSLSNPVFQKKSGQKQWDESVRLAIANTKKVSRPPPTNFPSSVVIRFDEEPLVPAGQ
jgi:hypothetical protein